MNIMVEYTNRYGDVYTFTKQEDGNILMEGKFEWMRSADDFIDPSGGPFIKKGQMLSHIIHGDDLNVIVESFERVDTGYIIKVKEQEYDPNDMSHLADTKIVGGIINTTETFNTKREMTQEELVEWLKEYRLNLMSLMGQDDYVTGKLDVIKDVLDKCNTKEK